VEQNNVVAANAGMSLFAGNQSAGIVESVERAMAALESGKALASFKKLMSTQQS